MTCGDDWLIEVDITAGTLPALPLGNGLASGMQTLDLLSLGRHSSVARSMR